MAITRLVGRLKLILHSHSGAIATCTSGATTSTGVWRNTWLGTFLLRWSSSWPRNVQRELHRSSHPSSGHAYSFSSSNDELESIENDIQLCGSEFEPWQDVPPSRSRQLVLPMRYGAPVASRLYSTMILIFGSINQQRTASSCLRPSCSFSCCFQFRNGSSARSSCLGPCGPHIIPSCLHSLS